MRYFLHTVDTIPDGMGFSNFSPEHLIELAVFLLIAIPVCLLYRRSSHETRRKILRVMAVLLIADEIFKHVMLLIGGNWAPDYLPLHLCSINLFLATYYAWKPSRALAGFLYCICLPAALAALLFPNWSALPVLNFMRLHSLSVHILLALYPLMLLSGREVDRNPRQIPKCLLILVILAAIALVINLLLDTNFMFLMEAPENSPLYFFETAFGNHLLGFPIIIAGVMLVMYLPLPKKTVVKV